MTDLKLGRKIGVGRILKFWEMMKKFRMTILMEISKLRYEELPIYHEIGTIGVRIMSGSLSSY